MEASRPESQTRSTRPASLPGAVEIEEVDRREGRAPLRRLEAKVARARAGETVANWA